MSGRGKASQRLGLGLGRHVVQHGVDEFRFLPIQEECVRHVDEFGYDHFGVVSPCVNSAPPDFRRFPS